MPSRRARPSPASCIIAAMAATAKAPLAKPSRATAALSGSAGPPWPSTATSPSAAAESRQPAATQKRSVPRRSALEATPTVAMPRRTPAFWVPESVVDWPGVKPKTRPA